MGIPICGACRRPIEERVVTALGKHWHVEVLKLQYVSAFSVPVYMRIDSILYFSILCARTARSRFWVTVITKRRGWHIAKLIIISYLEICVSYAIKLSPAMVRTYAFFQNIMKCFSIYRYSYGI